MLKKSDKGYCALATATGFEPVPPESKSGVLPLHYAALSFSQKHKNRHFCLLCEKGKLQCLIPRSKRQLTTFVTK